MGVGYGFGLARLGHRVELKDAARPHSGQVQRGAIHRLVGVRGRAMDPQPLVRRQRAARAAGRL